MRYIVTETIYVNVQGFRIILLEKPVLSQHIRLQ